MAEGYLLNYLLL